MPAFAHLSSLLLTAALASAALSVQAAAPTTKDCSALRSCAAKICQIENNIAAAQANGNTHREAGLRRALTETQASCTDSSLRQERLADIDEHKTKVQERETELAEARAKGKQDKIDKAQRKLAEAQSELKDAEDELQR